MKRVGLFVDTVNLYNVLKFKYGKSARLSYVKYLDFLEDYNFDLKIATCLDTGGKYGTQKFHQALEKSGFDLIKEKLRKYTNYHDGYVGQRVDCDVTMTVSIMTRLNAIDHFILGSNDEDLLPLIRALKISGKKVSIFASIIPDSFKQEANYCIEIPESLLEKR